MCGRAPTQSQCHIGVVPCSYPWPCGPRGRSASREWGYRRRPVTPPAPVASHMGPGAEHAVCVWCTAARAWQLHRHGVVFATDTRMRRTTGMVSSLRVGAERGRPTLGAGCAGDWDDCGGVRGARGASELTLAEPTRVPSRPVEFGPGGFCPEFPVGAVSDIRTNPYDRDA